MKVNKKGAFSVGELMIMLLILSIIMAAFMPIMTKREHISEQESTAENDYWQYATSPNIYYSDAVSDDNSVLIGVSDKTKFGWRRAYAGTTQLGKLIVNSSYSNPYQIIFKDKTTGNYLGKMFTGGTDANYPTIGLGNVAVGTDPSAPYRVYETGAIAIGSGYTCGGITRKTTTSSDYAIAIGQGAWGNGENSIAIGVNDATKGGSFPTQATSYSIAIGTAARASQGLSVAIGPETKADGVQSIAIGRSTASGDYSIAIGSTINTMATANYAIAIGNSAEATAADAIAFGDNASATGLRAIALGKDTEVTSQQAIAIGNGAKARYDNAISIGACAASDTYVSGGNGISIGFNSFARGPNEIAIGPNVQPSDAVSGSGSWTTWNYIMSLYGGLDEYEVINTESGVQTSYVREIRFYAPYGGVGVIIPGCLYVQGETTLTAAGEGSPFTYVSDIKLKNIKSPFDLSIDSVKDIRPYKFVYKQDPYKKMHTGIIAQDIQKTIPNAVGKDKRGYFNIDTNYIFYTMINSVKELDTKISALWSKTQGELAKIININDKLTAYIESYKLLFNKLKLIAKDENNLESRLAKLEKKTGKMK